MQCHYLHRELLQGPRRSSCFLQLWTNRLEQVLKVLLRLMWLVPVWSNCFTTSKMNLGTTSSEHASSFSWRFIISSSSIPKIWFGFGSAGTTGGGTGSSTGVDCTSWDHKKSLYMAYLWFFFRYLLLLMLFGRFLVIDRFVQSFLN